MDFLDVEQVEVLRGPQGTLFGKNTTSGAINVTTRKPSFTPGSEVELNYGNFGYVQAKASVTGPLFKSVAGRISFSGTQRDGVLLNTGTGDDTNDLNNLGVRGQILVAPSDRLAVTLAIDHTRQRPKGYTQVVAGVAPTLRPANRQYPAMAADFGYTPPSFNTYDRLTDVDTPMRSYQSLGGTSLNVDFKLGPGRVTSTTAYRYWDWKPSNDRDFIGLPVTSISAAPSYQTQWTQEVRYAGGLTTPELRDRRVLLQAGPRFRSLVRAGAGLRGRAIPAGADARRHDAGAARRLRLQPVPVVPTTSAPRVSGSSSGESPTGCGCCLASGSTTTRRTWTSISRSTAGCRPLTRHSSP